jgi:protein-S-isoprenylcysteine O-methyltransferase Ste14
MLYILIIILYFSYLIDFIIWPIPSEVATGNLLKTWKNRSLFLNLLNIFAFVINAVFTLTPLVLSIHHLLSGWIYPHSLIFTMGLIIAWLGRIISIWGTYILYHNEEQKIISCSIFRWSRNPISFGLYLTFLGLTVVFPYYYLIIGWIFFMISMHYKIGIEERYLHEKYGDDYLMYKKSTPKYLLF